MQDDLSYRFISHKLNLRIYATTTLNIANKLKQIHQTTLISSIAMVRATNAAILLASSSLKPGSNHRLSLNIFCNGPIDKIIAQVDARGNVRAYISNKNIQDSQIDNKINLSNSLGAGIIKVTRDLGLKEPYEGISPILYGDIAKDIANHIIESEQIPSAIILAANLNNDFDFISSGGILIQTFPDTPEKSITFIENQLKDFSLDNLLQKGQTIKQIVDKLTNDDVEKIGETKLQFNCNCNKNTLMHILHSLDDNELKEMAYEDKGAEINCMFCNSKYYFTQSELEKIIKSKSNNKNIN